MNDLKGLRLSTEFVSMTVQKHITQVQGYAKALVPVSTGELRESINTEVTQQGDIFVGSCYTNKKQGVFVEFGTGPIGETNHEGISPDVNPVYTQDGWWIHESQISKEIAEKYGWIKSETKNGVFYLTHGQPASPFLYPALHDNKDKIMEGIRKDIRAEIRRQSK